MSAADDTPTHHGVHSADGEEVENASRHRLDEIDGDARGSDDDADEASYSHAAAAAPLLGPSPSCTLLLASSAAEPRTLYLQLLPAELVAAVDMLVATNAWRWAGALAQVLIGCRSTDRWVTRDGRDLLLRSVVSQRGVV